MRPQQSTFAALGLAGSALVALAAPRALSDPVVRWWYSPGLGVGRDAAVWIVYAGMAIMCAAWLGLGRSLPCARALVAIAVLWTAPLAVAPPLFSRDVYSYLAQGTILHLGHNPYHTAPAALAALGRPRVLAAVSPFWRSTTAPYGPLFLGVISLIAGWTGSHLVAGVLLVRALELLGLALLALALPALARAMGSDGARALWLVLLGPLTLLALVAPAHNDLLMAGLEAVGLACALAGLPLLGVALCALAATVKLPALAGAAFIAVAWLRAERGRGARVGLALGSLGLVAGVLGTVTLATGVGSAWVSSSLFSTPARVRLAITPATAVGYTAAWLLRGLGVAVNGRALEGVLAVVAAAAAAAAGAALLWRVRPVTVARSLAIFLMLAAVCGPAAWPWYLIWGLVALAATRPGQRGWALPCALAAASLLVKPDGILALPLGFAPAVLAVYLVAAALVARAATRRAGVPRSAPTAGQDALNAHAGGLA
ncbi:MAG TPA: polyprenol phosphomannose-dependent alpha 1,6 mannosyltransferase MptB [Solirubrobacteraceae bacterium]|nr:polyprenol phosphomannose-dependent alpha 1,6 mannosyltransferase MptB [Solirubrobacteraceae bacterium]